MPKLEHDERNQTQQRTEQRKNKPRILTPHVVEKRTREQRRHRTQRIAHETLSSDGGRGRLAVAVRGVRVRRLEDEVDAERDGREADDRADPVHELVLREGVDEEADGQPDGAEHGAVQAVLGHDGHVGIRGELVVLAHLEVVRRPAEERADCEGDVGEAGDALVPAVLLAEGDGDHGEEEEDDRPAEGDP